MKCIVAGSRSIINYNILQEAFTLYPNTDMITEIVSGEARGADKLGERWACDNNLILSKFPAQWTLPNGKTDRGAGIKRNIKMGDYADIALILWDGVSTGSLHMYKYMKNLGKPVTILIVRNNEIKGYRSYNYTKDTQ